MPPVTTDTSRPKGRSGVGISIGVEHSRQNPPVRILPRDRPCPVGWARSDAKQADGFAQIRADTLCFEIYVIIFSG